MRKNGFTLIELLVVVVIIAVLAALIFPLFSLFSSTSKKFDARVIDVWTDMDGDSNKIYRCRTQTPTNIVDTWDSYYIHQTLENGTSYHFEAKGNYLTVAVIDSTQVNSQ